MCQPSQLFTAVSAINSVNTGNPSLDGTGPMSSILTATQDGTVLQTITIKATDTNSQGMIRLFIQPSGGASAILWKEIPVPATGTVSGSIPAYQTTVRAGYIMQAGDVLYASTQNSETWNILAEAISWENCACPA